MENVVQFRPHMLASTGLGYKSGRKCSREIPEIRSTARTRKGGTSSHCEIACAVMPSGAAKAPTPPAAAIALCRASFLSFMTPYESIAFNELQALLSCQPKASLYDVEMTLGKRIRAARIKRGLNQRELGEKLGVTSAAISGWERDQDGIDSRRLPALQKVLKVPYRWLLNGVGDPPDEIDLEALIDRLPPIQRRQVLRLLSALAVDDDEAA